MSIGQFLDLYRQMGPLRFLVFIAGLLGITLILVLLGWWLGQQVGWPERYGFACHGRGCLIESLAHSPKLLIRGSKHELALFAYLWSFPAIGIVAMMAALFIVAKRWHRAWRNRIRPWRPD